MLTSWIENVKFYIKILDANKTSSAIINIVNRYLSVSFTVILKMQNLQFFAMFTKLKSYFVYILSFQ